MHPFKVNKIKIDGKNNITLQDVNDSTININTSNLEEVQKLIYDLHELHSATFSNTLNIIVLSSTHENLSSIKDEKILSLIPFDKYNNEPKDWQPFNNKASIIEILLEFHRKSGFKLDAFFIDNWSIDDDEIMANLKDDISPNAILIIDALALHFDKNKAFAKIFDKSDIGGCIVPICNTYKKELKAHLKKKHKEVLPHLNTCFHKRFGKEYMFVELEVKSKDELFRRLANIAIKHLEIRPLTKVKWHAKFLNQRDISTMNNMTSTF